MVIRPGANEVCKWADEMGEIQVKCMPVQRNNPEWYETHCTSCLFLGREIQARVRNSLFE